MNKLSGRALAAVCAFAAMWLVGGRLAAAEEKDFSKGGKALLLGDSLLDSHKGDERIERVMADAYVKTLLGQDALKPSGGEKKEGKEAEKNSAAPGNNADAEKSIDDITPALSFDAEKSKVIITVPGFQDVSCTIWCYEDGLGSASEHRMDGPKLILVHKSKEAPTVTVTTVFTPSPGGVEQLVTVEGDNEKEVRSITLVNPCIAFRGSPAFGPDKDSAKAKNYVDDFVARCFVFLDKGLTLLKDTKRVPGTLPADNKDAPRVNCENPWIQEYYPAWARHPGQYKGQRGFSTDRPVYPIIGVISHDQKYLAAAVWPEAWRLGQVWMHCVHTRSNIGASYDAATKKTVSRGKIYFLRNDSKELIKRFEKDFPDWKKTAERAAKTR